jgi:hypothetical protein
MMMLKSVNASTEWYPTMGKYSGPRNKKKMQSAAETQPRHGEFIIPATKSAAEEYYTYYDQLLPHFKIEKEFKSAANHLVW